MASTPTPAFAGSCSFYGENALIEPPAGLTEQHETLDIGGAGQCTGIADGKAVTNAVMYTEIHVSGTATCEQTTGDLTGTATLTLGSLVFPVDAAVQVNGDYFHLSFTGGGGSASGSGAAIGSVSTTPSPFAYDRGCFTGTQTQGEFEFSMKTTGVLTPLASTPTTKHRAHASKHKRKHHQTQRRHRSR